jgi:predicted acylesterase/phospholipase RssA
MIPPLRIVLSGGGIKVVALIGALRVLEKNGSLKNINEICGVSAGAFLGFIVATGIPLEQVEKLVLDLDFSIIRNIKPEAILEFPERFGIDDGKQLVKFLESIFRVILKLDPAITFSEFAERAAPGQLRFRCWATDLNTHGVREFSKTVTPNVKIIDALRASMALPLYFTPVLDPIHGHMLTDGGVQGNLPLHHLTDEECEDSLSLKFSKDTVEMLDNGVPFDNGVPQDLMEFVNSIFACLTHSRNESVIKKWSHKIINISVDEYPSWNFEASRSDRSALLKQGSKYAKAWCDSVANGSRRIERRHSF